ncbi:MAG: hypothetical protein JXR76_02695 [Deltaproteobacteria bacterium]|nr:hypothetical protein [Deltaproteobacteria bacterium]
MRRESWGETGCWNETSDKVGAEKKGDREAWSDSADRVESAERSKMWGVTAIHVTATLPQDP